ncbi:Membrane associated serine protease, rhomboid family [Eubacterium ruminantium]|nr:Membrane associated serine protease, rhomboid family [Eubacterium ruminantium]
MGSTSSGEKNGGFKLKYNAPVTLTFAIICLAVLGLDYLSKGKTTMEFFSVYRSKLSIAWFVRLFGHSLGHIDFNHLFGNMTLFLLLGPILEEKYGARNLIEMIAICSVIESIVQIIFIPKVALLGASGVVFMMIIVASAVNLKEGDGIPITMILVILVYLGKEVWAQFAVHDNVSHITHIVGGLCGAFFGFAYSRASINKRLEKK